MESPLEVHSLHFLHKGHQTMFNLLYAALISSCLSYQKDMSNTRDKSKYNFTKTPISLKGKKLARWSERFIFRCPMPTCINHVTSLVLLKNSSAAFFYYFAQDCCQTDRHKITLVLPFTLFGTT